MTHLSLNKFKYDTKLKVTQLKGIDFYLPKLQYLYINSKIITDEEEVTQLADSLSRLSSLQTIYLRLNYPFSGPIEEQIREKCRKIKEIEIKSDSNPKYYDSDSNDSDSETRSDSDTESDNSSEEESDSESD